MITIQQGEILQYLGRILRRAKGATDYEVIDDLTPYGIELSITKVMNRCEVHRFKVYKEGSTFYTEQVDTSQLAASSGYSVHAALVLNDAVVVANNSAHLTIERSLLGSSIESTVTDYGEPSITEGSIESGDWEYQIELAQSGSDAAINKWSDSRESVMLALGVVIKGDPFTYGDFTDEQKEELQQPAIDAAEDVMAINLWELINTTQSYVSTYSTTKKTINTTVDHRSMTRDVEVGDAQMLTLQIWNPNKIDNTVEDVELRIANRFAFYDKDNTEVVGYVNIQTLDGSTHQTQMVEVPDGAYWVRFGLILGYSGEDNQTFDDEMYAMIEVGDKAHSYRAAKADLKGDTGTTELMSFEIKDDGYLYVSQSTGSNIDWSINEKGELVAQW